MKKILVLVLLISLCAVSCAPPGYLSESRYDKIGIKSVKLGKVMTMEIFVPPGYEKEDGLSVLYMLHGYAQDGSSVMNSGLCNMADILIEQGIIEPMVIVAPQIDNSFLLDSAKKTTLRGNDLTKDMYEGPYADYFIEEAMRYIEENYKVNKSSDGRFIGGFGTGGYAAVRFAVGHPGMFSKAGGHMPVLWTPDMSISEQVFNQWFFGSPEAEIEGDLTKLAEKNPEKTEIYIDSGRDDELSGQVAGEMAAALEESGYDVHLVMNEGKNDMEYIDDHLFDYLTFYGGGG